MAQLPTHLATHHANDADANKEGGEGSASGNSDGSGAASSSGAVFGYGGEISIVAVRAAVYYYEACTNLWRAGDGGLSRVDLMSSPNTQTFRIVAVDTKTEDVVINTPLFRELVYTRVSNVFHQWSDGRVSYGLNFATQKEAVEFARTLDDAILKLLNQGSNASLRQITARDQTVYSTPVPKCEDEISPPPYQSTKTDSSAAVTQVDLVALRAELLSMFNTQLEKTKKEILGAVAASRT
ncbi:Ena/VASP-like protein [Pelomyxa schiedti]|nr:Ena/VASP-like protein [Pelomyxa schiedti]